MTRVQPVEETEHVTRELCRYLLGKGVINPRIDNLRRLTGGSSHDTWALDLTQDIGRGPSKIPLVMRRNFSANSLDMTPEEEYGLLSWLVDEGLPVARPWLCATADSPFGVPFVLAERIDGTDLRKAMAEPATPIDPQEMARRLVELQAHIHALDLRSCPQYVLRAGGEVVRQEVERWTGALLDCPHIAPGPLARVAVDWLRSNVPVCSRLGLVHGDFKANNILRRKDGTVVVLDWELAHVGDPVEDLAWTMLWMTRYDLVGGMITPAAYIAAYEAASGAPVDRFRLRFWQLFGFVKLSAILLSGSGAANVDEPLSPSQVLLSRAVPCLEAGMAAYLRILTAESAAA